MTRTVESRGVLTALAARFGRDTAIFAATSAAGLGLGLLTAVVLTHLMTPAAYGELAVMLVFSSLLTTVYNLSTLQGTLLVVFGASGDEDADDDAEHPVRPLDLRAALTTGLAVTAAVSALGTLVVLAAAGPIADWLAGGGISTEDVVLAAGSAALGAVWRLAVNVLRMERRTSAFVGMQLLRPVAVLAISWPLVASSGTPGHALTGLVAGTGIGLVITLAVSARSYAPRLQRAAVLTLLGRGMPYVPISLVSWTVHTADTYIVAAFSTSAQTGEYRFASRLGVFVSYFTSAFLMAWAPVRRTGVFAAATQRDQEGTSRLLVTGFFLFTAWLVLISALASDLLVRLAPPAYAASAPLIPLIALGWSAYAFFVVVYRVAEMPGKRKLYIELGIVAAVLSVGTGCALTAAIGPKGAAIANLVAFACVTAVLITILRARGAPVPLDGRRLTGAALVALALFGAASATDGLPGAWHAVAVVVAISIYPVVLLALGIAPRRHGRELLGEVALTLRPRAGMSQVRQRLGALDPFDRELVLTAAEAPAAAEALGARNDLDAEAVAIRLVHALRRLAGGAGDHPDDAALGRFLLTPGVVAERDVVARRMWSEGVDAGEMERLELTLRRVRQSGATSLLPESHVPERP
jgi:O-antigen/teichoic acid export membrane protein